MKIGQIILALTLIAVPTDKIQCRTTDVLVAVECTNVKIVKSIFEKHGLKIKNEFPRKDFIVVFGMWRDRKDIDYYQARNLFFDLAKRKEVIRIY